MSKEKQETGYVYILTNPSFREDWVKLGKSSGHREQVRWFVICRESVVPVPMILIGFTSDLSPVLSKFF